MSVLFGDPRRDEASTRALQEGFGATHWTLDELWVSIMGIGGSMDPSDVRSIAAGTRPATPAEHDIMASALNDFFVDNGGDHPVRLWDDL